MHDLMEFRRVMGEAAATPGAHPLFPGSAGWDATYLGDRAGPDDGPGRDD